MKAKVVKLLPEKEFSKLKHNEVRTHLIEVGKYLQGFPVIKNTRPDFERASKYLNRADFCSSMKKYVYSVFKTLISKTAKSKPIDKDLFNYLSHYSSEQLVKELRERGLTVTCKKITEIEL